MAKKKKQTSDLTVGELRKAQKILSNHLVASRTITEVEYREFGRRISRANRFTPEQLKAQFNI
jgi:hypothetical protein